MIVVKKDDDDHMGRKVSLCLILGLILIGFVAAPAMAEVYIGNFENGDVVITCDTAGTREYYHHDTGKWETSYFTPLNKIISTNSQDLVPASIKSSYLTVLPTPTKPLPTQATIKTIPTVKYEPVSSSFVPYPSATLTGSDSDVPFISPTVKDEMHHLNTDLLLLVYPEYRPEGYSESGERSFLTENRVLIPGNKLGVRGQSIGDIVHVSVIAKPEIKSEVEPYFYEITGIESWPGDQLTIWGWVPLNKIEELSNIEGVYQISTEWGPETNSADVNTPGTSSVISSSLIKPANIPSQSISKLHQTGVTSSGASRFTQYIK